MVENDLAVSSYNHRMCNRDLCVKNVQELDPRLYDQWRGEADTQ